MCSGRNAFLSEWRLSSQQTIISNRNKQKRERFYFLLFTSFRFEVKDSFFIFWEFYRSNYLARDNPSALSCRLVACVPGDRVVSGSRVCVCGCVLRELSRAR